MMSLEVFLLGLLIVSTLRVIIPMRSREEALL